jgi:hypothetical protein
MRSAILLDEMRGGLLHGAVAVTARVRDGVAPPVDVTPPTITSANPSGSYAEGVAIGGTLTADEAVTWTVSGDDANAVELDADTWTLEETDYETRAAYSFTFRATDGAGNHADQVVAIAISDVAEQPIPQYGRTPNYDAGTDGDWFVAPDGSDDNAGTSAAAPFATLGKAYSLAQDGDTIRLRAGTYREQLDQAKRLTIAGYGTGLPVITGAHQVTGWTACTGEDAGIVGDAWPNVYKATVSKSLFDPTVDYYHMLMLTEAGQMLDLAQRRADTSDLFEQTDAATAYSSTRGDDVLMTVDGDGVISSVSHPSVLSAYTDAQLARVYVMVHADPNVPAVLKATGAAGGIISVDGASTNPPSRPQHYASTPEYTYALLNILPAIGEGQWGFVDNGETLDLYVWPLDAGHVADGIEIAARAYVLALSPAAAGSVYRNLQLEMCADSAGGPTGIIKTSLAVDDLDIEQCVIRRYSSRERGQAIYFINCDNFNFRHNEIRDAQNTFGLCLSGTVGDNWGNGAVLEHNLVEHTSQTGFRIFGQRTIAVRFNRFSYTGKGAHSNKINFYLGCDVILLQGNVWEHCEGYITLQDSSRLLVLNNIAPGSPADGRAFVDQTRATFPPTDPSNNYLIGNLCPAEPGGQVGGPAIRAYKQQTPPVDPDPNWGIYNNVAHGIASMPDQLIGRENNVLTLGEADGAGEVVAAEVDIYYDGAAGNWQTIPGSPLLDMAGKDVSAVVAEWEGYFPALDLRRDVLGNAWDPAASGVGPYALGAWPVQADTTAPTLSDLSASISGATASCSVSTDEMGGTLYWQLLVAGGDAPSAAAIKADPTGSQAVGAAAGVKSFGVAGTVGEAYDLYVTHEDRHGNLAEPVGILLEFAAYAPLWVPFDGTKYLRKDSAIPGAQAKTQTLLAAVTHKHSSGVQQNAVNAGILSLPSPSTRAQQIDSMGGNRLRMIIKESGGAIGNILDGFVPAQTTSADVEFLTLFAGFNDGANFRLRVKSIRLSDGLVIDGADKTTAVTNYASFADFTRCDLLKAPGAYERVMLWDNATADIADEAVRDLFFDHAAGELVDPAIAVAAIGTPLINLYGARLTSGSNAGSGGPWEYR